MAEREPLSATHRITATGWANYPCIFCGEEVAATPGPDDPTSVTVRFKDGTDDYEEFSSAVHGACFRKATPYLDDALDRLTIKPRNFAKPS